MLSSFFICELTVNMIIFYKNLLTYARKRDIIETVKTKRISPHREGGSGQENVMKWKPNKADAAEYGAKMREIEAFCKAHNISVSSSGDSYYFILNGTPYRVSNHSVSKSDSGMRDEFTGEKIRESYHSDESAETVYITAGKMRIIDIYNDLSAGIAIDGKGNRKDIS